jgi:hypothetical protein
MGVFRINLILRILAIFAACAVLGLNFMLLADTF